MKVWLERIALRPCEIVSIYYGVLTPEKSVNRIQMDFQRLSLFSMSDISDQVSQGFIF